MHRLGHAPVRLTLPRFCQGFMYGDKGTLKARWQSLGLTPENIVFDENALSATLF